MIYRPVREAATAAKPAAAGRFQTAKIYQFPSRKASYPADVRTLKPHMELVRSSLIAEIGAAALSFVFWLGWRVMSLGVRRVDQAAR